MNSNQQEQSRGCRTNNVEPSFGDVLSSSMPNHTANKNHPQEDSRIPQGALRTITNKKPTNKQGNTLSLEDICDEDLHHLTCEDTVSTKPDASYQNSKSQEEIFNNDLALSELDDDDFNVNRATIDKLIRQKDYKEKAEINERPVIESHEFGVEVLADFSDGDQESDNLNVTFVQPYRDASSLSTRVRKFWAGVV